MFSVLWKFCSENLSKSNASAVTFNGAGKAPKRGGAWCRGGTRTTLAADLYEKWVVSEHLLIKVR